MYNYIKTLDKLNNLIKLMVKLPVFCEWQWEHYKRNNIEVLKVTVYFVMFCYILVYYNGNHPYI